MSGSVIIAATFVEALVASLVDVLVVAAAVEVRAALVVGVSRPVMLVLCFSSDSVFFCLWSLIQKNYNPGVDIRRKLVREL